jgi:hypothetical protein
MDFWETERWVCVSALVVSGKGTSGEKGPKSTSKADELCRVTGLKKVPGSLNLLTSRRVWVRRRAGRVWSAGRLYPARVFENYVVANVRGSYGANPRLFHIYSDEHLRSRYSLRDGDALPLQIAGYAITDVPLLYDMVYGLRLTRRRSMQLLQAWTRVLERRRT